jgi:hypothetical protein
MVGMVHDHAGVNLVKGVGGKPYRGGPTAAVAGAGGIDVALAVAPTLEGAPDDVISA